LAWLGLVCCRAQGLNPLNGEMSIDTMPAFPAFCALAGFLCVHWSWGLQVLVWTRFRINYVYIFELDPRYTRSYTRIFSDCASDTIVYFTLVRLRRRRRRREVDAGRVLPSGEINKALNIDTCFCFRCSCISRRC
jgi:hypothetical protein